jgi:hypothetical protein
MNKASRFISIIGFLFLLTGCAPALHDAAARGDIKAVEDLLSSGGNANEKARYGYTPLMRAAESGNAGLVKLLISKGADVNARNIYDGTALKYAAQNGHTEVVKQLLLYEGADVNLALISAADGGHAEIVKLLLDKGADVNTRYADWTPLRHAARKGHASVAKMLLDRGADLDDTMKKCSEDMLWATTNVRRTVQSEAKDCLSILVPIFEAREEAKRREKEIAKAKEIETDKAREMKEIIREVVAETAKTQKQTIKSPAIQANIEKPDIAASERILSDNDIAVIIGIEGYSNLPKSDYSYNDARLVKEYAKALGFRERNIELITDEKATKTTIEKTLEVWLRNKAKPNSLIFIYYSGHGSPDPTTGESYIVPHDGDPNYLAITGYPLKRLYEKLGSLHAKEVIVVLDACFSGAGGRSVLAKGARPLVMTTTAAVPYSNMAVVSAAQGSQISSSSPEKGLGIFTYYFLKALNEGKKNVAEIYEYLKPLVEDDAKEINVQQSPSLNPTPEKLAGRFILRK